MPKNKSKRSSSDSDSDSGPDDRAPAKKSKPEPAKSSKSSSRGGGDEGEPRWDLGKNRHVKLTEFKGKWYVDIREFYLDPNGDMKPGRKGIMLTMEQWQKFKGLVGDIEDAIKTHV